MIREAESILKLLHEEGVEFVIIGGICNVLHGVTIVTQDVEVCCRFSPDNLKLLEKSFQGLNPVHRQTPGRLPFVLDEQLSLGLRDAYLRTDLGVIDCLSGVAGIGGYEEVLLVSIPVGLSFGQCQMLSIDALRRDHDLAAVKQLRAIKENRETSD